VALTRRQIERFHRDGYVVAEHAVTPAQLADLLAEIELPEQPVSASFFTVQGQQSAAGGD
jgi:hypothetical protein